MNVPSVTIALETFDILRKEVTRAQKLERELDILSRQILEAGELAKLGQYSKLCDLEEKAKKHFSRVRGAQNDL